MFVVIPAVDLKGGKVVRLVQGDERKVTVELDNPLEVARMWVEKGARVLHVIDLDGAFRGSLRHEDTILRIKRELDVEVQVGGGIRDVETAKRLISIGLDRVIIGTLAVENVEAVRRLAERYPRKIMIAIDSKKGRVVVKGWKEGTKFTPVELAGIYDDLEVSFLYTNVDIEGLVKGVVADNIKEIVENINSPVYVAGGIASVDDIRLIKETGAKGVIVGSALYTGRIRLEEALKLEEIGDWDENRRRLEEVE
jgi:phosphoribosylformimino-5-aminoimidazole carboxamide ribotide isomerase